MNKSIHFNKEYMIYSIIGGLLITFSAFSSFVHPAEKNSLTMQTQVYGRGELRTVEGVKFLKLSGSYYEMGIQYGALMKREIKAYLELGWDVFYNEWPGHWLAKFLFH